MEMDSKAAISVSAWSGYAGEKLVREMLAALCAQGPAAVVTPQMVLRTQDGAFRLGKKTEDPTFLPPEGDAGEPSVVWSLAALSYYLFMGVPVFGGMPRTLQTASTPVPSIPPRKCSRELAALLAAMLDYDPGKRPALATLAKELVRLSAEETPRLLKGEIHPEMADESFWKEEME